MTAYSLLAVGFVVGHVLETDTLWLTPTLPTDARKILILFSGDSTSHGIRGRVDDEWIGLMHLIMTCELNIDLEWTCTPCHFTVEFRMEKPVGLHGSRLRPIPREKVKLGYRASK